MVTLEKWVMLCTPRTASTSISKMLDLRVEGGVGVNAPGRYFGHIPARVLRQEIGEDAWENMFTFGFVRNPWDRLVSIAARINPGVLASNAVFEQWMRYGCLDNNGAVHFAAGGFPIHWSCSSFVMPCKFIGRYETLAQDMTTICRVLGLPQVPPWRNDERLERGKPYWEYYTEHSRAWVDQFYHQDIVNFGYRFKEKI